MKNSLEEQLDTELVNPPPFITTHRMTNSNVIEYMMTKLLLSSTMIRVCSLLPKSTMDTFIDRVTGRRFGRYLDGSFRDRIREFMDKLYNRPHLIPPAFTAIGSLTFKYLPVDTSDVREPEVRIFTEADICSTLSEDAIDSVREAKRKREAPIQPDLWKDLRVCTGLSADEMIDKKGE